MDVGDLRNLHAFQQFQFEEEQSGWDMMLRMIKSRTKDNRVWSLIKRIREVRRLYWNLIKKSNTMNQSIIGQSKAEKMKKRVTNLALNQSPVAPVTGDSKMIRFADEV